MSVENLSLEEMVDEIERSEMDDDPEYTIEAPKGDWASNLAEDERLLAEFDGARQRDASTISHEAISVDLAEYFANGGRVTLVPQGQSAEIGPLSAGRAGTAGERRMLATPDRGPVVDMT